MRFCGGGSLKGEGRRAGLCEGDRGGRKNWEKKWYLKTNEARKGQRCLRGRTRCGRKKPRNDTAKKLAASL